MGLTASDLADYGYVDEKKQQQQRVMYDPATVKGMHMDDARAFIARHYVSATRDSSGKSRIALYDLMSEQEEEEEEETLRVSVNNEGFITRVYDQ